MAPAQPVRPQTRKEAREQTRARILRAASAVFESKGFAGASVEEIAAKAGYTRGAFYSNFASKDAVFFALMDARMEQRVSEIETVMTASPSPTAVFADLAAWSQSTKDAKKDARTRMMTEFRVHALRNKQARQALLERERAVREQFERAIRGVFAAAAVEPPAPVEEIALLVYILDTYGPLQRALDPDMPENFLFDTLSVLFRLAITSPRGGR